MALINYAVREISAKIVYYGPGLSGKTTNIKYIHSKVQPDNRGKLVSLATETDRTLFFDFFPVEFGTIGGFKVRFHFYTVPGQVFYNTTRKLVLKGADGVVFVADSQEDMEDSNIESLINLKENLAEIGLNLDEMPFVIQYNKRDLPNLLSVDKLQKDLNPENVPYYEASAMTGQGVMETMKLISKIVLKNISETKAPGLVKPDKKETLGEEPAKPASPKEAPTKEKAKQKAPKKETPNAEKVFDVPPPPPPPPTFGKTPSPTVATAKADYGQLTADSIRLKLDEACGKTVETELVLPALLTETGNVPVLVPLFLEMPPDSSEVKLKVTISASYHNKDGMQIHPKKKGFIRRLFGL